jgi:hypothetical protein
MKGNPLVPGGSLTSKPTWSNASGCSDFFLLVTRDVAEGSLVDKPCPNTECV